SPLLRVKTHSGKQINEQSYISSCTRNMTIPSIICKYTYLNWYTFLSSLIRIIFDGGISVVNYQ
ncbi:MAG: hypothetical protein WBP64_02535, partial [Nitrososphaeraceae archaeon]